MHSNKTKSRSWKVVGHRGYPQRYPENTIPGFEAAAALGVDAIELDVQLSKDNIPIVIHDMELKRTSSVEGLVSEKTCEELQAISCHYPEKFGAEFFPTPIASLKEVCQLLAQQEAFVFIEIKRQSIPKVGRQAFLKAVLEASSALLDGRAIISFDWQILDLARQECNLKIGWCLDDLSDQSREIAERFTPDMLICENMQAQGKILWSGPWQWFVYGVESYDEAQLWSEKGASWIEANDPARLIQNDE